MGSIPTGHVVDFTMVAFEASVVGGALDSNLDELRDLGWYHLSEVRALAIAIWMVDVLAALDDPVDNFRP